VANCEELHILQGEMLADEAVIYVSEYGFFATARISSAAACPLLWREVHRGA